MNRNIWIIIISSGVFSLCFGVYDFVFPLFLKARGLSFQSMGIVFSIAALAMYFLRIFVGVHSDLRGRKPFYALGMGCSALSNLLIPAFSAIVPLVGLHMLRETATIIRDTMRSILVFENARDTFHRIISKTVGLELFVQGAGTLLAGQLIMKTGVSSPFYLNSGLLVLTLAFFLLKYNEKFIRPPEAKAIPLRDLLRIDLPPQLKVIAFTSFVFTFGLSISHSFIMPLFFIQKFGVDPVTASVVLMIHRMSLGIPMFIYGSFIKKHLAAIYIGSIMFEGLAIAVSACIPSFLLATSIWLLHDILGAALWSPVQNTLIQKYARNERRGKDVSEVAALGSLGAIFGPIVAGLVAPVSISLPFLVSGVVVFASAFALFNLRD